MTPKDSIPLSPGVLAPVKLNVRIDSLRADTLRPLPTARKTKTHTDSIGASSATSTVTSQPSTSSPQSTLSNRQGSTNQQATVAPSAAPKAWSIPMRPLPADSTRLVNDSIAADSITPDTVAKGEPIYGIILEVPEKPEVKENPSESGGMSYIIGALILLFCIIGLRFRNNRKYITALFRNLVEVRLRSNVFDETVRETSFIVLLNLLWSCSAGMVLCALLVQTVPSDPESSFSLPVLTTKPGLCTAVCMGLMTFYSCAMAVAYLTVGSVFSDLVHARMWVKGFAASQGLLGVVYFPLALLLLFYPGWSEILLYIALSTFFLAKLVFIWKGFRIFFTQFSSWVLFLYYLCSLEIVPLILTYLAACQLCSLL